MCGMAMKHKAMHTASAAATLIMPHLSTSRCPQNVISPVCLSGPVIFVSCLPITEMSGKFKNK